MLSLNSVGIINSVERVKNNAKYVWKICYKIYVLGTTTKKCYCEEL